MNDVIYWAFRRIIFTWSILFNSNSEHNKIQKWDDTLWQNIWHWMWWQIIYCTVRYISTIVKERSSLHISILNALVSNATKLDKRWKVLHQRKIKLLRWCDVDLCAIYQARWRKIYCTQLPSAAHHFNCLSRREEYYNNLSDTTIPRSRKGQRVSGEKKYK